MEVECIMCLCVPTDKYVSCKNYGCDLVSCGECLNTMVSVCYDSINSMPMCECGCEYLSSQLRTVLSKSGITQYNALCVRKYSRDTETVKIARSKEMLEAVKSKVRAELYENLPSAIANLIVISGLEKKLTTAIKKKTLIRQEKTNLITENARRKCVSFVCKGRLIDFDEDTLSCSTCHLFVCKKCDSVKSNSEHVCKTENVESVQALNSIARCPQCNVPATKGEGCVFITCPYCHTNFDSTTGLRTNHGGHNDGMIRPMINHKNLSDLVADENIDGKMLLNRIQLAKPNQTKFRRPDIKYESEYIFEMYNKTINKMYELRDLNLLTNDALINIAKYVESL